MHRSMKYMRIIYFYEWRGPMNKELELVFITRDPRCDQVVNCMSGTLDILISHGVSVTGWIRHCESIILTFRVQIPLETNIFQ